MKPKAENPDQMMLPVFLPVVTALGNGTYRVDAGKPLFWLSAHDLAVEMGVDRKTIYRWRDEGFIPRETDTKPPRTLWRERGQVGYEFSSELVPILRATLKALHE